MARSSLGGSAFAGNGSSIIRRALLLSALLPALGAAAEKGRGERGAPTGEPVQSWSAFTRLTVVWVDPTGALPFPSSFVAAEVRSVFATIGVTIDWRKTGFEAVEDPEAIRVILLREEPSAWRFERCVLGIVSKPPGSRRTIWVVLSNVRQALQLSSSGSVRTPGDRLHLARALGRVTAHEIFHVVAPWHSHADTGLMQETLNRKALRRSSIALDLESREVFLSALAPRHAARLARRPGVGPDATPPRTVAGRMPDAMAWMQRQHRPFSTGPPQ